MGWCGRGGFGAALFEPHDDDVEHRRKEETEAGHAEHAEEDGGAERLAHFGTGAAAENQRKNAENEGEGGHQDRAQAEAAGFDRGGEAIFPIAILNLFGELDDEDGVLAGEADEHDEADLGEDVVLHRAQPDAADRAEQTHRDDQNDRERQRPAFVKRREEKEDEENAERENVDRAVAGEFLLQRHLGPLGGEARGQNFFRETFDGSQRVARAGAGRGLAAEVGGREHVVARDFVGAAHFLHGRDGTERNHSAGVIARLEQADVVGTQAKLRVGLRGDAIGAAEEGEVVHVGRTEIGLERAEDIAQRHVHALRLHAIHVEPELRHVGAKGREVVGQARRLIRFHHHGEGLRLQFLEAGVAAILNEKSIAAGIADPGHRRWRKDADERLGNLGANARVHLRQDRGHSLLGRVSLREFLEG